MLDLGKFLRDRKKDVVNRWQNSTVLDAVSANTQADQARRVAQGQPQQYQGNKFAQGLTNIVGANKMQDTSVQDRQDDQTFKNDLSNIINLRTSGQITPEQARGKALNAAPTGNTDYTKDVLNNQANRSSIGQAVLPALGTFAKPFATGLSDVGTAVGTGVEAFTPFNGVGKNIQDVSKRQSQGIDDLYKASSFNGGQKGENRLVTGLSSGVGSLASSLATGATKGLTTNAGKTLLSPSTMSGLQFGLSAGAGQMRDATANNKSAVRSFGTGLAGGAIEAGLEKVGLDKYLGAGGGFVRKTGTRMLTEGLQEGAQSLGQSLITGSFKRVDPVQALKQAALEGGMGGLVGGIGGVGGDLALNLQQSQSVPQDVKQQVVQSKPVLQQTGIPAQPGSVRERIQIAKENVTNKIASSITPMDQAEAIPNIFQRQQDVTPTVRANQNELGALKSYLDYQYGLTPSGAPTAQELNLLNRDVRTAAQRLGIPLNNGLNNNAEVIREYLDTVGTKNTPKYTTLESQQPKPSLMNKLGIKPMDEVGSVPMDSPLLPLNKLAKNTSTSVKKYEKTFNVNDSDDAEYLARIVGEDRVKQFQSGDFSHFRGGDKAYYEGIVKGNLVSETPKTIGQKLEGRIKPYKMGGSKVYHVSSAENTQSILKNGFKKGSELPEDAYRGGGYGQMQDSISFATKAEGADRFATNGRGVLLESELKPNSKVVEIKGVEDATELNELIPELRKQGVDAVHIGGGENEVVVINPESIKGINRYKEFDPRNAKNDLAEFYNQANKPSLKDNQSGSVQIPDFIANIAGRIKNSKLTKNEGGYAKNPFYDKKNEVAKDLSPEQSDFINEYANMLKNMGQDNGVDINPMTGAKISNNVRTADTAGKAMTEADWFNEARKQIESGKGAYGASEEYKNLAKATAIKTEALKKQGKITPKDEGYWSTPIKGQPKTPIPGVKDTNGLTPMEGDKIEFDSILGDKGGKTKKGTATVRWSEPSIANASGKEMPGQWLGNGALDSNLPFTIVERNGKPIAPQVGKTDFNKLSMAELNKVVNDDYKRLDRNTLVTEALEKYPSNPKATKAQGEQIVADRQKYIDGAIKSFNEKYGTDFEDMSDLLIREDYVRDAGRTEISDFRTSTLFGKGTPDKFYTNSKYAKQEMGISTPQTVKITPNNQRTIDSYSTPKPVTEYKVGEKVSNATAQGGTVNGTITKTPDFSKDLRLKGNDFIIKLADGTTVKTSGAGFDAPVPQANKSAKKPFKPLSTPEDNIPAIAKQVTKTQGDKLDAKSYADTFGISQEQAELDYEKIAETANKPATLTEKGKDTNKLFEEMKKAPQLDKARAEAQASGKEMNFFAKKDKNDRSVGIEQFDPNTHTIEAGFVVDKQGRMLGNHIKVDANGIQVNIGGKVVNMDSILGNPLDWGNQNRVSNKAFGKYRLSETMNRNIDHNAPSKEVATKTKNFLWSNKVKAEADMRTELDSEYKALGKRIKNTNKAKPMGVSSQQWKDDIFSVLNGDKTDTQIKESYGDKPAQAILDYKKETRTLYDSLLQRVNVERVKFGQPEIQARKDYITHLQELNGSKNFVAEVYGQMKNSFADEGMGKTRNGVPGEIAGRTENFKPISKYNPFLQRRTGTKSERDPYMAVQEYLQPALYNIHMTESGARARAIESAFRTAEQIRNTEPTQLLGESKKIMDKYKSNSDNAKLITGFQEYANAIAGKTQRFDRQLVDSSDAAAKGLKGWQALQRTGGRATILGNASSILAQPLNQVVGLADAGPINYMKGISAAVAGDPAIEKSAFVRARSTEPTKAIRKTGEKVMDAGSIPLQAVELASVKLMWHTQHQKALSQGYKGQEAIQQADLNTERLAAGRGIADKPELYRSTIANGVLQYTLEVNASNKTFWQDLDNKQKATFLVASTATNTLMGAVTGFQPLPDFLKAIFDTGKDILDGSDSQNIGQELASGAQRVGDQYASMNPLVGAGVNLLPQTTRKAVFGQESTIGRYSGASAPIQVVENAAKTLSDVTKGKYKSARDNALRDLPFGNQVRKTVTGAEMLNRGYAVDSSGKKTFDSPSSPLGKAQALVFGPSATKPAREYYDKSSSKPSNSVATKDAQGNETTSDNFDTISKAAFNSPKGKEFVALKNEDARKEFARQSPDNRAIYNDYKAMQKAFNGGDKLLATGLDENSTKTLQKYDRLTPKAKENIFNSNKNAEYEYELASYNNKKANGEVNLVDEINTQQKLNKLKATKDFDKGYRDMYAGLSKTEAYSLITSDPNGKKIADQLLAIDDALVKAGNKAKFRDKYGNVSFAPKSSSGRKGGRSKSNGTVEANSLRTDTLSKLNSLLAGAQKPVTGFKKVASAQPKLKKITVKK